VCLPSDFRLSKAGGFDPDGLTARDDCGREGGSALPVSPAQFGWDRFLPPFCAYSRVPRLDENDGDAFLSPQFICYSPVCSVARFRGLVANLKRVFISASQERRWKSHSRKFVPPFSPLYLVQVSPCYHSSAHKAKLRSLAPSHLQNVAQDSPDHSAPIPFHHWTCNPPLYPTFGWAEAADPSPDSRLRTCSGFRSSRTATFAHLSSHWGRRVPSTSGRTTFFSSRLPGWQTFHSLAISAGLTPRPHRTNPNAAMVFKFALIYELTDGALTPLLCSVLNPLIQPSTETIDFGYPQNSETDALKAFIMMESIVSSATAVVRDSRLTRWRSLIHYLRKSPQRSPLGPLVLRAGATPTSSTERMRPLLTQWKP